MNSANGVKPIWEYISRFHGDEKRNLTPVILLIIYYVVVCAHVQAETIRSGTSRRVPLAPYLISSGPLALLANDICGGHGDDANGCD